MPNSKGFELPRGYKLIILLAVIMGWATIPSACIKPSGYKLPLIAANFGKSVC